MAATVLVVDDDKMISSFLESILLEDGYEVLLAETGAEGESLLAERPVDIMLLDLKLPDEDGISILRRIKQQDSDVQVIVLTAFGAVESAVEAMKLGAYDYVDKPSDVSKLKLVIERGLEELTMRRELERLRLCGHTHDWIVGESKEMQNIAQMVTRLGAGNATVLLQGESGTGKEVVANAIHKQSPRADKPFVVINCAAIPENLLESELFGFEAGAFTSAKRRKKGLLEVADGGTLFLDEIGEMPAQMQSKILRVLETKTLRRIGGTGDIKVDVRFIAATNQDLRAAVQKGTFRQDLFYRLSVVIVDLPPLRERVQDLERFVVAFVDEFNRTMGKNIVGVSSEVLTLMRRYAWPGNIRELRNVIERGMVLCDETEIQPAHLPAELCNGTKPVDKRTSIPQAELSADGVNLEGLVAQMEQRLIKDAMARTGGNQIEAAQMLSISRDQLRYRLQKYEME
jgi:two-component system NtrC family response regulator